MLLVMLAGRGRALLAVAASLAWRRALAVHGVARRDFWSARGGFLAQVVEAWDGRCGGRGGGGVGFRVAFGDGADGLFDVRFEVFVGDCQARAV